MPAYTLVNIRTRILDQLDNAALYTNAEVDREINHAIVSLNLHTGFLKTKGSIPGFSVADKLIYDVPTTILFALDVFFEGRQLQKKSLLDISREHRTWTTDRSNRQRPVQSWVPLGIYHFAIHPRDSEGGRDILVFGVKEPTMAALVLDGDTIVMPDEDLETIEELALPALQFKEGGGIFAHSARNHQKFLSRMKRKTRFERLKMPQFYIRVKEEQAKEDAA